MERLGLVAQLEAELERSLEQACRGMAGRVEPYLDSPALYQWTQCAMEALCCKDVKELRCRLPELLQASDVRVLQALAPSCEAYGMASFMSAERQVPEVGEQTQPTPAQVEAVSELAGALLITPQAPVASELAEAPLSLEQAPEVVQPAPEPMMQEGRAGALCAKWSGCHTSLCEVPPGGASPAPAPAVPRSTPSTGVLWLHSTEQDSWPWPARGHVPELT